MDGVPRSHKPDKHKRRASAPLPETVIADLLTGLEAQRPVMLKQLADLLGKAAPRVSAREKRALIVRLRRKLRDLWPRFAELEAFGTKSESAEKGAMVKTA